MHNIVFDCERMKYEDTGIFHYCYNLGVHLQKSFLPKEESLTFYTPYGVDALLGSPNQNILQTELHKFYMPRLKPFTVWHATYQGTHYLPIRNKSIKVVLTIHDLNFMYDPQKSESKKQRYLQNLQRRINRADVIICISEYCKKDVMFYCDIGKKPIHVIYNGTNRLQPPALTAKSFKPIRKFIFTLGTIVRKKNFHSLLPLVGNNNEFDLVIAGRSDDMEYCNQILYTANNMGIKDQVHLVGRISEEEKSWYYNNCSAFAFPSTAEGFGLPVAEAMSIGKPIFLSNKTALPEIGGDVAFYFDDFSEDVMIETFKTGMKKYLKLQMQDAIKEKGKIYNWSNAANDYLNIYRSLY